MVARGWCPELGSIVDENNGLILNVDEHVFLSVSRHISKLKRNGCEILPVSKQGGAEIDTSVRSVAPWKLNNLNVTVKVKSNKV